MNIAFFVDPMNYRGIANSSFQYALYNEKILKNKSIIFHNKNLQNEKTVILKFKKKFKVIEITNFDEIDLYKDKLKIDFLYLQKGGELDHTLSKKIKTLVHFVYPQKLSQIHGYKYSPISEWLSKNFSNSKIPFLPYIVEINKSNANLKKKLRIKKNHIVFGCHGGQSSFDLKFVQDAIVHIVKKRNDIIFLFLNINKFCHHKRIKFLNGTSDETLKKKFLNSCDAMIYGRSLGESFGLACGEFAILDKPIISYKFNRHKSHQNLIPKEFFHEYHSYKSLEKIIFNFKKKLRKNSKTEYKKYKPKKIMNLFEKTFLKKSELPRLSILDYIKNYLNHIVMNYFYFRHKIYSHYYNIIESRFRDK